MARQRMPTKFDPAALVWPETPADRKVAIYVMCSHDPDNPPALMQDWSAFYVGRTENPRCRELNHLSPSCHNEQMRRFVTTWRACGMSDHIHMHILEWTSKEKASRAEAAWVETGLRLGWILWNVQLRGIA